ncbi:MAG: hypothetical protein HY261_05780 [Chloroflexi bacterium]|nr:hypothetical protein [Chloroflexota bacterium]
MPRNTIMNKVAIAGVGHAGCYRDAGMPMGPMAVRACKMALDDAGLTTKDVDGFGTASGAGARDISVVHGWNEVDCNYMIEALGLPGVTWFTNDALGGVPGVGTVALAAIAVASGLCEVAMTCRVNWRPKSSGYGHVASNKSYGQNAFFDPYGYGVFPQKFSSWYQRYMHEYGVTREQLGTFVVQSRQNYLLGDKPGVAPKHAITMEDYLAARWVAEPMCLLDHDFPCDGAAAVVVTTAERARSLRQKPVYLRAISAGQGPRPDFVFWHDYTQMASHFAAKGLWEKAQMSPKDLDLAQVYDGFTPFIFYWMDALGIAKPSEVGEFVGSGALAPTGVLPTNLNGGQINEGRVHTMGHVIEAVQQLQHRTGKRQVKDAERAIVCGGGLAVACILVLSNQR